MGSVDNRNDRIYWAISNLTAATFVSLPLMWGLARETSLKFVAGIGGTVAALNAVRLLDLHEQGAPVRSAWTAAGQMVSTAWIEEMALSILPPRVQQQEFAGGGGSDYYLLPPPQPFQFAAPPPENENLPDRGDGRTQMPNLSAYPSVLIHGPQGSGKTTFAEEEVQKRLVLGHEVIVLDPHAAYGAWRGCQIIGGGMNYEAIDKKLQWLFQEIKNRYQRIETEPNPRFKLLTVTAEEFTRWSVKVKSSSEFFWTTLTDIRKVGVHILFVSHTRTLVAVGGAKGSAELRDEGLLEVHLLAEKNEKTNKAFPKFEAWVKLPGDAPRDRFLVKLDRHSDKLPLQPPPPSDTSFRSFPEASSSEPKNSGSPGGMQVVGLEAILSQILKSSGNVTVYGSDWGLSDSEKFELAKLVIECEQGKEKRILYLWGAKSGGRTHQKYVEACGYLDRLIAQINQSKH